MSRIDTRYFSAKKSGFDIVAYLEQADCCGDEDMESYNDNQIKAYENGDWTFVTLVVEASRNGVKLGSSSIGGMEYGLDDDYDYAWSSDYYMPDLIEEAVKEAKETIKWLASCESNKQTH